ncbi:alpha/beta fold hydrolase [Granulicella arctica]|uniref:Pimeloyl-ACP methyl ester carboxylesterase n=1 Tax=Granulicella arctica TaxID=940613 RepID=A0A7Y9TIJ0_9BACT|nr:alpha/beta hydrolase [Granulicella arctica]NYF81085.1 pimeloyl-ACP methyl ester carboxylesterase [Granulicella arctica]
MKRLLRIAASLLLIVVIVGGLFYRYPLWFLDRPIYYRLWRAGVEGKYVDLGGNRIHYYEAQAKGGGGVPLVLIHGLGSRGEDWANLIPTFAANGFHVYAPDLLGYGRSSRPDVDYSIATEENVVVQFMQAMHLSKASVIGWSMGGWIAMRLALDHPGMVDRLVLYDSAGIYFPADISPDLFAPTDVAGVQRLVDILEPEPRVLPGFVAKDSLRKLQRNGWIVNRSLSSMTGGRYLLDFRLGSLKQPMLILWGGADHLIPPSAGETIHKGVPQSVFEVVEGCGHLGPAECAKPYLEGTIEFLKAQPPMPPGEKTFPKP